MKKLILIDGNSLLFRAYFAMRPMVTSKGMHTQGVFAFVNMLGKILKDYEPSHIAVAFDLKGGTFRHEVYKEYKAGRLKTPPELLSQIPLLHDVLHAMNIAVLEVPQYEADDIIGTVAARAERDELDTLVISGDNDELQLIGPHVNVLINKRGMSEFKLYDDAAMMEEYGFDHQQFIDYKADVEKPLPMIYQSGYLTIKGVRRIGMRNIYKLDFPNAEVAEGFLTLVANNYLQSREDSNSWLYETAEALENGDLSTFERALTAFLASIPYTARRHENEREKERYFQYTVYLLMRMVGCYTVYHEKETSAGRADCVVETPGYVYIFEYKLDRPADEALAQIDAMGYAREYADDRRKVYKIACCFSSETGTVSDFKVVEEQR